METKYGDQKSYEGWTRQVIFYFLVTRANQTSYLHDLLIVEDWDGYEEIWKAAFNNRLGIDPTEHPLLCTEPAWNPSEKREKLLELAFEKFNFPAFYLAKDAVMTA